MIKFKRNPDVEHYKYDYPKIFKDIKNKILDPVSTYRSLILNDLFFIVYFVMEVEPANHPFVVEACKEVENGPKSHTLDLWAREHYKTTIITKAETIQDILKKPESRTAIVSHTRAAAQAFLRSVKVLFETSSLLKACFPDVLYDTPEHQSPKWSENEGIVVKRTGTPTESTLEAWGLIEGMPTGRHFNMVKYDDIMVHDYIDSPMIMQKLKDAFDQSMNIGTEGGRHRVIGTTYHHQDVLAYLRTKCDINGKKMYVERKKAATHDGTAQGRPLLLSQDRLDELKANQYIFNCQQLLDPTPTDSRPLSSTYLKDINPKLIPRTAVKVMLIDPAGDDDTNTKTRDNWALGVFSIDPQLDNLGQSNIYIEDAIVQPFGDTHGIDAAVRMFCNGGIILKLGVEKAGNSKDHIHIKRALHAAGRYITEENGSLVILSPGKRVKKRRIESALSWPMQNGKWHISTRIPLSTREHIRDELDNFPLGFDDFLDIMAYLYEIMEDMTFDTYEGDMDTPLKVAELSIV